jgi:hypothetical protein
MRTVIVPDHVFRFALRWVVVNPIAGHALFGALMAGIIYFFSWAGH